MHKRIGLMAGGAAVALVAIAGCSNSSSGSTATGSNGSTGSSGSGGSTTLSLTPVAEIQAALTKASNDKTVHVTGTITSSAFTGTMDAQEQYGDNLAMSMNMSVAGTTISEVLTGDTIYMKVPQLAGELGGKPWAKIDLSSAGSLASTFQSLIDSAKNSDPTQQLQPLLASGDLKKAGTETVDGISADHYTGTVDPATAFDSSQAAKNLTPDQISQLKSFMKAGGVTKESIDVWVDPGTSLPVRELMSMNSKAGPVKVDLHMKDWGKPVTITAPPADQVGDLSSMMGSGSSS